MMPESILTAPRTNEEIEAEVAESRRQLEKRERLSGIGEGCAFAIVLGIPVSGVLAVAVDRPAIAMYFIGLMVFIVSVITILSSSLKKNESFHETRLSGHVSLLPDAPEKCLEYLKWCQANGALKSYQDAIGRMSREPSFKDWRIAKEWISKEKERMEYEHNLKLAQASVAQWSRQSA